MKINCLIVDDEPMAREILDNHLSRIENIYIAGSCRNAIEAFNFINSEKIDLIFLDINMPDISGLSFAKSINRDIKIIFTTAYREYAIDGFDLRAVDYLLKPISYNRLLQAVSKYMDENARIISHEDDEISFEKSDHFFVRSDRKMIKIRFADILYIESMSDYVKIYLEGKTIISRETGSSIEARLPQGEFIRTHRSYIVAMAAINSYTSEVVEAGGREIPISRSYKDSVLERLEA